MDPISLILSALAAGATEAAGSVVQDSYAGLKALIMRNFESQGKSDSATILDMYEESSELTEPHLRDVLAESGADKDEAIIRIAQEMLSLLHPQEAAEGKYIVKISGGEVNGFIQHNTGSVIQNFNKS